MTIGYTQLDLSGIDLSITDEQTLEGFAARFAAAKKTGALIIIIGLVDNGTPVQPAAAYVAGNTIRVMGYDIAADGDILRITPWIKRRINHA